MQALLYPCWVPVARSTAVKCPLPPTECPAYRYVCPFCAVAQASSIENLYLPGVIGNAETCGQFCSKSSTPSPTRSLWIFPSAPPA